MAQVPSRTSVMVRSSKALQVLDGLSGPPRVVEAVSLHADRNAHGEWWSPCAFRSASSDSQQSALGTAQTSDEKAVKKERPHGFSMLYGVSCGPPTQARAMKPVSV